MAPWLWDSPYIAIAAPSYSGP